MKVCEVCGKEISTRDGDNRCRQCDELETVTAEKRAARRARGKERDAIMRSFGLVKVRGALGGTYWE